MFSLGAMFSTHRKTLVFLMIWAVPASLASAISKEGPVLITAPAEPPHPAPPLPPTAQQNVPVYQQHPAGVIYPEVDQLQEIPPNGASLQHSPSASPIQHDYRANNPPTHVVNRPPASPGVPETHRQHNDGPGYPLSMEDLPDDVYQHYADDMETFVPDSVLTITLPSNTEEFFYQDVGQEPTLIRGNFFVSGENDLNEEITFTIYDPAGESVLKYHKSEGVFRINTTLAGTYVLHFSNVHGTGVKHVTFGVAVGNEDYLLATHVNDFGENIEKIAKTAINVYYESQYLWGRQNDQMKRIEYSASWIFWLCLFELLVICAIVGVELHFLKALVANRCLF